MTTFSIGSEISKTVDGADGILIPIGSNKAAWVRSVSDGFGGFESEASIVTASGGAFTDSGVNNTLNVNPDTTGFSDIEKVENNKFLLLGNGFLGVFTVSGNTITNYTVGDVQGSNSYENRFTQVATGKILVVKNHTSTTNFNTQVVDLSGTTLTVQAEEEQDTVSYAGMTLCKYNTNKAALTFNQSADTKRYGNIITVSGSTSTLGTERSTTATSTDLAEHIGGWGSDQIQANSAQVVYLAGTDFSIAKFAAAGFSSTYTLTDQTYATDMSVAVIDTTTALVTARYGSSLAVKLIDTSTGTVRQSQVVSTGSPLLPRIVNIGTNLFGLSYTASGTNYISVITVGGSFDFTHSTWGIPGAII